MLLCAHCALYDSQGTHLDSDLVYKAFNLRQIKKCKLHKDKWVHLMVGSHQHVESAGVDAGAIAIKYRSTPTLHICVAGSLASAVAHAGDLQAAAAIAKRGTESVASLDAFMDIKNYVNTSNISGWHVQPLGRDYKRKEFQITSLASIRHPCVLHVEGVNSRGQVERTHAITVANNMVFDANHRVALPLTKEAVDECIPGGSDYTFRRIIRGFMVVPSKRARCSSAPSTHALLLSLTRSCVFLLCRVPLASDDSIIGVGVGGVGGGGGGGGCEAPVLIVPLKKRRLW